jgi:hypothetical protein
LIDLKFGYVVIKLEFWVNRMKGLILTGGQGIVSHRHVSVNLDNVISAVELCFFKAYTKIMAIFNANVHVVKLRQMKYFVV